MSYILEALASSEQARQQIAASPKYSLLPVIGEELPQQRLWPYALAGALLVNAVVLQVWLRPALPGGAAPTTVATAPQLSEAPPAPAPSTAPLARSEKPAADAAAITSREATPAQSKPQRVDDPRAAPRPAPTDVNPRTASANQANDSIPMQLQPAPKSPPKVIGKRSAEDAVAIKANRTTSLAPPANVVALGQPMARMAPKSIAKRSSEAAVATETKPTTTPSPALPASSPALALPASSPAPALPPSSPAPASAPQASGAAEFPPMLQQELPVLSVAGFIREGANSMVIVNDKLVHEGDEVAPGVKLEKILNDSVVFNYKGYRFRR